MRRESFLAFLISAPWWLSAALAPFSYLVLRYMIPMAATGKPVVAAAAIAGTSFAPFVALFFLCVSLASFSVGRRRNLLFDSQSDLESIRSLSWKDFELLVGEAYRRQGYAVIDSLRAGPDGGVDLSLRKDGLTTVVQCKNWRFFSVGAPVVRELFGVMTACGATRANVITSGRFTKEARAFAQGLPIELIDGPALLKLIQGVQNSPPQSDAFPSPVTPVCSSCGAPMVLRTAARGPRSGNQFWGCTKYPACKQTGAVSASA